MYSEGILSFRSYVPEKLEKGMYFAVPHIEEFRIFKITKNKSLKKDINEFIELYGLPLKPYIISPKDASVIATPEQIGYFDDDDFFNELKDISKDNFNEILINYNSKLFFELDETTHEPFLLDGKVIISYYKQLEDLDFEPEYEYFSQ